MFSPIFFKKINYSNRDFEEKISTRSYILFSVTVIDVMFIPPQQFFSIAGIFRGKKGGSVSQSQPRNSLKQVKM